jgi:RND family efflux transporter MFP subunit
MKKKIITLMLAAALIAAILLRLIIAKDERESQMEEISAENFKIPVTIVRPQFGDIDAKRNIRGEFVAVEIASACAEIPGKIREVYFDEGDFVKRGRTLAIIENDLAKKRLDLARRNYVKAEKDYIRLKIMQDSGAVAKMEFEAAEIAMRKAGLELASAEEDYEKRKIVAAGDGYITEKYINMGSVVAPGTPIAEISDISAVRLEIEVSEEKLLQLEAGSRADVFCDAFHGKKLAGRISEIAKDKGLSGKYKVGIDIGNNTDNKIIPGMDGSARLNYKEGKAITLPRKCIIGSARSPEVYIVGNGKAFKTAIGASMLDAGRIIVTRGLDTNARVVIKGLINLYDGAEVRIVNNSGE